MQYSHTKNTSASPFDDGDHGAELSHIRKPRRAKWERLRQIAIEQIAGQPLINPTGHLEVVLERIARGAGRPVPLYEIQRDRSDASFISDPQARIFYLKKQYGFCIENSVDHSVTPARSFYWIVLAADGEPKMNPVTFAAEKTGIPNNAKNKAQGRDVQVQAQAPTSTPEPTFRQAGLFEAGAKPPRSASRFVEMERGAL